MLQVFSPLRLNTDATVLLSMGESAARGGGFLDSGQKTVFPPGYLALLAVLLRVGLAHPWVIVGLNLVFLSTGLVAAYSLLIREFFEDKAVVLIICSFFLPSYVVVKHFTIPLLTACVCSGNISNRRSNDMPPLASTRWGITLP